MKKTGRVAGGEDEVAKATSRVAKEFKYWAPLPGGGDRERGAAVYLAERTSSLFESLENEAIPNADRTTQILGIS